MKIENRTSSTPVERVGVDPSSNAPAAPTVTPTSDSVELSPDLALANQAVQAVGTASDIRPEAVARAKALLERGEIGQDLDRLADKLIDSLLP